MNKRLIDKKGFVFLDRNNKPRRCCCLEGEIWLCYWKKYEPGWVTLCKISAEEAHELPDNLPQEQQDLYFERL